MTRTRQAAGRRAAAAIVLAGLVGGALAGSADASPIRFAPTYGADRYATSALVDDDPTHTAFLVTGQNFPDGLAAGAVAGAVDGNVYLVQKDAIPAEVRARIVYASKIVVVGGENSIGPAVMTWLQQNTRAQLSRVAGADRFDTAVQLSRANYPIALTATSTAPVSNVVIATGWDYPDALAGSAAAASKTSPLLLVSRDEVPAAVAAELQRLKPAAITVVGGKDRVSDAVLEQLKNYTGGSVERVAGASRYETADRVSAEFFPSADLVEVASGETFADALAVGARAGRLRAPLLLTARDCVTEGTNLEIERLQAPYGEDAVIESFGYTNRISEVANKRTNCQPASSAPETYLDGLPYVEGSGRYRVDHATIDGHFYPRSTAFDTDPRNSDYGSWTLGSKYSRFTALAGVADGNASGLSSTVQVFGDERLLATATVSHGAPAALNVDVRGVDRIKIVTTTPGAALNPTVARANYVYFGDAAVS